MIINVNIKIVFRDRKKPPNRDGSRDRTAFLSF
jgi:hypothetical protein